MHLKLKSFEYVHYRASQVTPVLKNMPANAGDIRDVGSIPGIFQARVLEWVAIAFSKINSKLCISSFLEGKEIPRTIAVMCMCPKSLQSCPTLFNPMDCSLPGSSVHKILQPRIQEWLAMPSSRGSS